MGAGWEGDGPGAVSQPLVLELSISVDSRGPQGSHPLSVRPRGRGGLPRTQTSTGPQVQHWRLRRQALRLEPQHLSVLATSLCTSPSHIRGSVNPRVHCRHRASRPDDSPRGVSKQREPQEASVRTPPTACGPALLLRVARRVYPRGVHPPGVPRGGTRDHPGPTWDPPGTPEDPRTVVGEPRISLCDFLTFWLKVRKWPIRNDPFPKPSGIVTIIMALEGHYTPCIVNDLSSPGQNTPFTDCKRDILGPDCAITPLETVGVREVSG